MKLLRTRLPTLLALPLLAFLPSCASNKQPVAVIRVPPAERLTCKAEPAAPAVATDATVSKFIIDALEAGQSCRSAVQWLRDFSREASKP